jgi:predicted ATP-dependent endonuclease of OLD family
MLEVTGIGGREFNKGGMPLLLVEEPEARLHPQLQTKLADGLRQPRQDRRVQTIVTSHSPTIAAHVQLGDFAIMHTTAEGLRARSLGSLGVTHQGAGAPATTHRRYQSIPLVGHQKPDVEVELAFGDV